MAVMRQRMVMDMRHTLTRLTAMATGFTGVTMADIIRRAAFTMAAIMRHGAPTLVTTTDIIDEF